MKSEKIFGIPEIIPLKIQKVRSTKYKPSQATENRAVRWLQLLGEDRTQALIEQAHKDIPEVKRLLKIEANRYYAKGFNRSQYARKRLAKAASASTG